ncbi:glycosyltransferase, partial [uncultured Bacteroides sp.]
MTSQPAPILLFVYNRPEHARQCIESLRRNALAAQSPLFIYSDAARQPESREGVAQTRRFIRNVDGFLSVTIIEREQNWGLARSIIDGVTTQVNRFGRVIVMEDDLIAAPHFLQFMNDALETYKDEPRVGHIQGCDFT